MAVSAVALSYRTVGWLRRLLARGHTADVIFLYGLAIFVSAGLVFLVQPMTAKLLLPTFGGSPQG